MNLLLQLQDMSTKDETVTRGDTKEKLSFLHQSTYIDYPRPRTMLKSTRKRKRGGYRKKIRPLKRGGYRRNTAPQNPLVRYYQEDREKGKVLMWIQLV